MHEGDGTVATRPTEQSVRAELNRLLETAAFRSSKRCKEFLVYVVEHTLSGPQGALKERSIGIDLFQLPADFDSGQHTIVRVTANEVRKKLAQQYLAENGSPHAVRIDLPPGSYCAAFTWATPAVEVPDAHPQPASPPPSSLRPRWTRTTVPISLALILVMASGFAGWKWHGVKSVAADAKSSAAPGGVPNLPPMGDDLRMIVGATASYTDRSGRTWGPDRFFSGGSLFGRSSERILRTIDPDIYRRARQGDFRYDIPLKAGRYELHLHFAETGLADFISAESSGEGQRVFRVLANGKPILNFFDVVADAAGANISDERVFKDISPAEDGFLHLSFSAFRGSAMVSAIEAIPMNGSKIKPIRIRAGWTSAWRDSTGQDWHADSYFMGGNALVRSTNPARDANAATPGIALYGSERWGHFSYSLPVADGQYKVILRFCEGHYGRHNGGPGGAGSRVFDVYCNGVALLRNFDIFKQAGGEGLPVEKSFSGIRPTAQGKIVLTFVPVNGMACVNGIEVSED
jgi:hypothetical protein